jgi:hypothetical protein
VREVSEFKGIRLRAGHEADFGSCAWKDESQEMVVSYYNLSYSC